MRTTRIVASAAAACALALGPARPALAQAAPTGTIEGVTRDATGAAVAGVEVSTQGVRALSDSGGGFRLRGVPQGRATLQTRRLGYRATTTDVDVRGGQIVMTAITLAAIPQELDPVVVEAVSRPGARRLRGFYERKARSSGYFITREQIAPFDNGRLSDALRSRVPSVNVSGGMGRSRLRLRAARCAPLVWIDGAAATAGEYDIDVLPPSTIAAVEVYPGPATVPVEFRTPFGRDGCGGAIVIWSRMDYRDDDTDRRDDRRKRVAEPGPVLPVYHADEVDQPAKVDSVHLATPTYPDSLFAFNVPGKVVAEFVVDTSGRPMLETIGVVTATHPAFGESVRRAVAASRFFAAQKGGKPVRQVMLLPFEFTDRSRRPRE